MLQALGQDMITFGIRLGYLSGELRIGTMVQFTLQKPYHTGGIAFLPGTQKLKTKSALIPAPGERHAEQAILALADPQGMK
jgi:hypothetical protein